MLYNAYLYDIYEIVLKTRKDGCKVSQKFLTNNYILHQLLIAICIIFCFYKKAFTIFH